MARSFDLSVQSLAPVEPSVPPGAAAAITRGAGTSVSDNNTAATIGAVVTGGAQDGVTATYNSATRDVDLTNTDKGSVAVAAHEALVDPHTQYTTDAEATTIANARIAVHAAATDPHGDRAYSDGQLGAHIVAVDPHGDRAYALGLMTAHNAALNPHPQYVQTVSLSELVDDRVASLLVAGAGVTLTYDDALNTLTVAAPGAGTAVALAGDPSSQLTANVPFNQGTRVWVMDSAAANTPFTPSPLAILTVERSATSSWQIAGVASAVGAQQRAFYRGAGSSAYASSWQEFQFKNSAANFTSLTTTLGATIGDNSTVTGRMAVTGSGGTGAAYGTVGANGDFFVARAATQGIIYFGWDLGTGRSINGNGTALLFGTAFTEVCPTGNGTATSGTNTRRWGAVHTNGLNVGGGPTVTALGSGDYTPTFTNVSNVASAVAVGPFQWLRVGDAVTVSGGVVLTPTGAGVDTRMNMTLPVASAFANTGQCAGTCRRQGNLGAGDWSGTVVADTVNDRAQLGIWPPATTAAPIYMTFTYTVI